MLGGNDRLWPNCSHNDHKRLTPLVNGCSHDVQNVQFNNNIVLVKLVNSHRLSYNLYMDTTTHTQLCLKCSQENNEILTSVLTSINE